MLKQIFKFGTVKMYINKYMNIKVINKDLIALKIFKVKLCPPYYSTFFFEQPSQYQSTVYLIAL